MHRRIVQHSVGRPVWAASWENRYDPITTFKTVRALARRWVIGQHGPWPENSDPLHTRWRPCQDVDIVTDTWSAGDRAAWAISLREPVIAGGIDLWQTTVLAARDANRCAVWIGHGHIPSHDAVAPSPTMTLAVPALVGDLLERCYFRDARLDITARPVHSSAAIERFLCGERRLPMVLLGDGLNADALAERCAGVAMVGLAGMPVDLGGKPIAPAMRRGLIIWPDDSTELVQPGSTIPVEQRIAERIGRCTQMVAEPAFIDEIRIDARREQLRSVARRATADRTSQALAEAPSAEQLDQVRTELSEAYQAWQESDERLLAAEAQVAELAAAASVAESDLLVLRGRLDGFSRNSGERNRDPKSDTTIRTSLEAVRAAERDFPILVFHQNVWPQLVDFEYPEPLQIYADLSRLAGVAARWKVDDIPSSVRQACIESGLPSYANGISEHAAQLYSTDYTITVDGEDVLMGPHFGRGRRTAANCYRTYFWMDQTTRRFIIGHIGAHLRDTTCH